MKTSSQIYLDFTKGKAQVRELRSIARAAQALANEELGSVMSQIDAAWEGEDSQAYLNKAGRLQQKIGTTAADISRIADAVERIVDNTYKAEMNALRIARSK